MHQKRILTHLGPFGFVKPVGFDTRCPIQRWPCVKMDLFETLGLAMSWRLAAALHAGAY